MSFTPKQRMLNAYKGILSDRYPVAPEFWYYYPARLLGLDMIAFEQDIPFWKALQLTFARYGTEGWGIATPDAVNPAVTEKTVTEKTGEGRYLQRNTVTFAGRELTSARMLDRNEPSWTTEYQAKDGSDLALCLDLALSEDTVHGFGPANEAYQAVGEDYLLEFWLGVPFFDFIASFMGFEKAIMYFMSEEESVLQSYRSRYLEFQQELIRRACAATKFESFCIGCSYSCNSLIGPNLWRQWDKPYIKAIAEELHRHGRLLHIHFHGRSLETAADFVEADVDCVCPFERPPGGDIDGAAGLAEVRRLLAGQVTMNGNVHTVATLIRGTTDDVRAEVRQIKEAFAGEARLIIGTGDQVGRETPEENILAMVEEAKA